MPASPKRGVALEGIFQPRLTDLAVFAPSGPRRQVLDGRYLARPSRLHPPALCASGARCTHTQRAPLGPYINRVPRPNQRLTPPTKKEHRMVTVPQRQPRCARTRLTLVRRAPAARARTQRTSVGLEGPNVSRAVGGPCLDRRGRRRRRLLEQGHFGRRRCGDRASLL